jgi:hypothetical protein
VDAQPVTRAALAIGRGETAAVSAEDAAALRATGVAAIALDLGPELALSPGRQRLYRRLLDPALGAPQDRGAYLVWWLDADPVTAFPDPEGWRRDHAPAPAPTLETLIEPLWPAPRSATPRR